MKKVLSILLAMVMVLSMTTAAFAATSFNENDYAASTADVTVSNAAAETTAMTAYQVIGATYDANSKSVSYYLTDWVKAALAGKTQYKTGTELDVDKVALALGAIIPSEGGQKTDTDVNPDPNDVLAILASADKTTAKSDEVYNGTKNLTTFTFTSLKVGAYFIAATDSKNVYSPMMVSVGVGADATGVINAVVKNRDISAKFTEIPFDKKITGSTTGVGKKDKNPAGDNGDDTNIGDTIHFEITNTVPTYADNYHSILYKFSDTVSEGLTLDPDSISVSIAKKDKTAVSFDKTNNTKNWTADKTGWSFELTDDDYIKSLAECVITITYDAVLNDKAETGFDANTNKARLDYTTKPTGETNYLEDGTYHYTFEIDGNIGGQEKKITEGSESWDVIGHEVIKVGKDEYVTKPLAEGETVDGYTVGHYTARKKSDPTIVYNGGLEGAVFTLTNTETGEIKTATTTKDGYMNFKGLDAGTYTLVETSAPKGYSVDKTSHTVVISAQYNPNGTLKQYSVTIDGNATTTYSAKYYKDQTTEYESDKYLGTTVIPTIKKEADVSTLLKNTPLVSLPSTGGMGTTLFTVAGCLIMIFAAGMFFVSRRKEER